MLRLALLCDFPEEQWPSMDLAGDMLFEHLKRRHGNTIHADRIKPPFWRGISTLGLLQSSRAACNAERLWNRMAGYPDWLARQPAKYDIFHIVDHSYAHLALTLRRGRTVVTCHDLNAFRCLLEPAKEPRPLWFRLMAQRILNGLRSAHHVIFVSEAVRQEARSLGLISDGGCSVIHNGVECEPENGQADGEARRLLGQSANGPLLLSVGSTVPRKRIDILLHVFAGVLKQIPDARLVRVGGSLSGTQADLARKLGVSGAMAELPFVNRAVLGAVYRRATILLQPSDSEGFGLPVVEAMAHGCPVVASDLPVLREIGGQAAVYCEVADVSGWTETVGRLLREQSADSAAWDGLRRRSLANAQRFSWRQTADRVAGLYQEIMEETAVLKTA